MITMPTPDSAREKLIHTMTIAVSINTLADFQARTLEAAADELKARMPISASRDYSEAVGNDVDYLSRRAAKIRAGGGS